MKTYKPQVVLYKFTDMVEGDQLYLHAVTFCDKTSYEANGMEVAPQLDSDGLLPVTLYITQNANTPGLNYLTPVTHTFKFPSLPFSIDEGQLRVSVVEGAAGQSGNNKKGESHVSTADSDDDARPIGG